MKSVNVKARVIYDYQVEIPDDTHVDLESYCDISDPIYFAMCKLMASKGIQWEGQLVSIVDKDTDEVLWDGE